MSSAAAQNFSSSPLLNKNTKLDEKKFPVASRALPTIEFPESFSRQFSSTDDAELRLSSFPREEYG